MKTQIKALLAAVGLAPAGQVDHLTRDLQQTDAKIGQLEERLVQLRADAEGWKRRYEDASEAMAGWKQAATRAQGDTDRAKATTEKMRADLERAEGEANEARTRASEWRARGETLAAELQEMRTRLQNAQMVTRSANEQLMAMEVKLDLLEAAIQVLDARTREQAVVRSS